jgi:hypothetical protein
VYGAERQLGARQIRAVGGNIVQDLNQQAAQ